MQAAPGQKHALGQGGTSVTKEVPTGADRWGPSLQQQERCRPSITSSSTISMSDHFAGLPETPYQWFESERPLERRVPSQSICPPPHSRNLFSRDKNCNLYSLCNARLGAWLDGFKTGVGHWRWLHSSWEQHLVWVSSSTRDCRTESLSLHSTGSLGFNREKI